MRKKGDVLKNISYIFEYIFMDLQISKLKKLFSKHKTEF